MASDHTLAIITKYRTLQTNTNNDSATEIFSLDQLVRCLDKIISKSNRGSGCDASSISGSGTTISGGSTLANSVSASS